MSAKPLPFPNEATSDPVAAALPVGASVAHLTIERVLHEGPYTIVYRASDPAAPQVPAVALMEYFPRTLALRQPDGALRARQAGDAIALSVGREAFVLEAEALERVLHPGVVRVIGSLQAHRTVYRAMELISGPTLETFVREREALPSVGDVAALFDALLDALQALHGAGVLHGQLRPDQVMITTDRRPVLLGMGSAAAEIAHHAVGPWSAPEQPSLSRHDRITSATDVYLAAATVWYFATGEQPPPLRERLEHPEYWDPAAALAKLPDGAGDAPGLKRRLCAALAAALALDPTERPQRVADVRRLLSPSIAPAPFQSSTTPLWVGPVPDRDTQWLGPAAAPVVRKPAAPRLPMPPAAPPRAALTADSPVLDPMLAAQAANDDDDVRPLAAAPAPAQRRLGWVLLLPLLAAGAALAWWLQRERLDLPPAAIDSITERAAALPPSAGPAASATVAEPPVAAPAPTAAPPTAAAPTPVAPPTTAPMATAPTGTSPAATGGEPAPGVATPAPPAPPPPSTGPAAAATPPPAPTGPAAAATPPPAPQAAAPAAPPPAEPSAAQTTVEPPSGEPPAAKAPESQAPAPTPRSNTPQRRAVAPAPTAPRELCSGRSQFSLVYCLQEVCSRPNLRYHAQCIELRRNGDIR